MAFLRGANNFVRDMMYGNCQRPFYVYFVTFIPAFVKAALMLRFLELSDIVRARGQDMARRGVDPRRGKRHGVPKKGRPLAGTKPDRSYRQALKHLLMITQPLETIGFGLLVYGVVDDFFLDWMMWIDDADACLNPSFFGPLIRKVDDGVVHPNQGGQALQLPVLVSNPADWPNGNQSASLPLGRYRAVFAATIVGPGGGASYELELRVSNVLGFGNWSSGLVATTQGQEADLIVEAEFFLPLVTGGSIQWVIKGPGVPVGLVVPKADVLVQRFAHFINPPS